jgi:tetratricopeptide (TPR) repeat protein
LDRDYRTKLDEIEEMLVNGQEEEAYDTLANVNWRKVHNVNALVKASEIYEKVGKLEEAQELLKIAHERSPIGRTILFHLALVSIKLGRLEEAKDNYNEFVEIAPHDSQKYVIKYYLSKARGADELALIRILEELKESDFTEQWSYELAMLYHKTAQVDQCINLCDEISIYFGDGPYVERALELKMLYKPLNKIQEDKYRSFQNQKRGLTEVHANENLASGEIVSHNMAIPAVELPPERFNTINLQAEIKKNIEEIMQATEEGEISENMDEIRDLVNDIPYLQMPQDHESALEKHRKAKAELDKTIKMNFQEFLEEEYDGQMSLFMPDEPEKDEQIEGQMTIDEVIANWEKTKRATEAALEAANAAKLANVKEEALKEATQIMDRLEGIAPKLDAGVAPAVILKQEYLTAEPVQSEEAKFSIPKVENGADAGVGLEIPIVDPMAEGVKVSAPVLDTVTGKLANGEGTTEWNPPELATDADDESLSSTEDETALNNSKEVDDVNLKEASMIIADVNAMLQSEIDRITSEEEAAANAAAAEVVPEVATEAVPVPEVTEPVAVAPVVEETTEIAEPEATEPEVVTEPEAALEVAESEVTETAPEVAESEVTEPAVEEPEEEPDPDLELGLEALESDEDEVEEEASDAEKEEDDIELPTINISDEELEQEALEAENPEDIPADESIDVELPENEMSELANAVTGIMEDMDPSDGDMSDYIAAVPADKVDEPEESDDSEEMDEVSIDEIKKAQEEEERQRALDRTDVLPSDEAIVNAIEGEMATTKLTADERDLFSYFIPIQGMEQMICQVLTGSKQRLASATNSASGNIIIQGGKGSGKTTMATSLIKVLQTEIGKPNNNVGRIDAERLNGKDIQKLFEKVSGGCLIIENAGEMTRDTTVTLSLLMENDRSGILVIMEDTRIGIERIRSLNPTFIKKFTEKITIPIFTADELVNFAKTYAQDEGYAIDEMGVLALYDRIGMIQRLDRPTYLTEVKEIVDEAIEKAEAPGLRGFFGRLGAHKEDENGNLILVEKDFQK